MRATRPIRNSTEHHFRHHRPRNPRTVVRRGAIPVLAFTIATAAVSLATPAMPAQTTSAPMIRMQSDGMRKETQQKVTRQEDTPRKGDVQSSAPAPPVITFPAEGLTLQEAVRLVLEHSPQIALERAELQFQEGVAQEQQGAFDVTLDGTLNYEYRQQELPETRKQTEQENRTDLTDAITLSREDYDRAQALIRQLQVVRNASPGAGQAAAITAIDADIGAQLQTLDLLIAGQTDAAIRGQLFTIRQNYIDRKVAEANEAAGLAVDGFQLAEKRLADIGAAPNDEVFINASFDFQLSRRLRNGIVLAPFTTGQFESTNYKGKPQSADFGGKGLEDLYTFKTGVSAVVPLARGRGGDATGALERASRLEAQASRSALRHAISESVLETVSAYWQLKSAQGAMDVARQSLTLQEQLLELTRAAINAGEVPGADLARSQAAEARARARLFDTERRFHEARVNLAIVIGVAVGDDDRSLPRVRDDFPPMAAGATPTNATPPTDAAAAAPAPVAPTPTPTPTPAPAPGADTQPPGASAPPILGPAEASKLVTAADGRRADLESATLRERAAQASARGAETDKRSRLDVVSETYMSAVDEKKIANTIDRWVGPSQSLRLELEHPFGNNIAEGRYAQRRAEASQRLIDAQDLRRQIQLSVVRTTMQVRQAAGRLEQSRLGVDASQRTTDAEIERFRSGEATLIDTLLTEQQLVDARLALVSAQADLATFIAQLRFETGTLVRFTDLHPMVIDADLQTLPGPETWATPPPGATRPPKNEGNRP
jgi:outer membrane protein TolC